MYVYHLASEVLQSLELLHFDEYAHIVETAKTTTNSSAGYPARDGGVSQPHLRGTTPLDSLPGSVSPEESFSELDDSDLEIVDELDSTHLNTRSPFVLFGSPQLTDGRAYGVYKVLFDSDPLKDLRSFTMEGHSVCLMIGGGHFAGAVISHKEAKEPVVIQSKTFHRYTTRRKQGGSQSASDNARGKANSAGSSIRRYNEQALQQEVRELLALWRSHIESARHIFVRANGANRKTIVEHTPINPDDSRIRSFPFSTKRPTLSEVKRSWSKVTTMVEVDLPVAEKKPEEKPEKPVEVVVKREKTPAEVHTEEITSILRRSKAPLLISYLKKNGLDGNYPLLKYGTPLHYASSNGLGHMVHVLLVNLRADPTIRNSSGKTAAQIGLVQTSFQIARSVLGEIWDWDGAGVGAPITKEEAEKREKEAREKEAQEKKRAMESLAPLVQPEKPRTGTPLGKISGAPIVSETSGLTDAQRMRVMREQRARAAEARMKR